MIYRALSVVKPYGQYISTGRKTIEVRNWQPVDSVPLKDLVIVENAVRLDSSTHPTDPDGRIVAIVDVTGIRNWEEKDVSASCAETFQDGWLAWDLGNIRKAMYPIKVEAKLRVYDLNLDNALLKTEPVTIPQSNYAQHAAVWGWGEPDRSEEIEFYSRLARRYGSKVLSLMCATGEIARGMAEKGFQVTAVDIEPEMIAAAKKNSPDKGNPRFLTGDVTDIHLPDTDFDFVFIGTGDFHHLSSKEEMLKVLSGVFNHLTDTGCLILELFYPDNESWQSPKRRFDLPNPSETEKKAWKFGETRYDAAAMRQHIKQEVFIDERGNVTSFSHEFDLQLISHETLNNIMNTAGFTILNEYGGFDFSSWHPRAAKWVIEAIKK